MTPEITKVEAQTPKTNERIIWVVFGVFIVFLYFFGLNIPLLGPDEPRYAQVAREMMERGDWLTPTLGGFNWFEKPPLLYWLEIVPYKLFGVSEFAARVGPALFGLGTIASLWILGSSVSNKSTVKGPGSKAAYANYLALIAASTLGILVFSRGASFDIIVTFPMTAALVCFFIYDLSEQPAIAEGGSDMSRQAIAPLCFLYIFVGIALLAKGLIGILFPFSIIGIYYLLARRLPSRIFIFSLLWGTLLAAAIASVWYIPMYQRHGFQFIDEFFIQHHFQRFTSNKYQHPQPLYFFFWVLPLMTLPWLPFFLASLWNLAQTRPHPNPTEITVRSETTVFQASRAHFVPFFSSPLLLFSIAWLLVPLTFFSFSGSKLPGYILPALPAAVILASAYVFALVQKSNKWGKAVLLIAASTFAAVTLLMVFAVPRFAETDSVKALIQKANERGYSSNRVLMLHTISHNAEFYAAGRLLRDSQGKQIRLSGVDEVLNEITTEDDHTVLVLVPLEYLSQITTNENLRTEVLKDNSELAIAAVSAK